LRKHALILAILLLSASTVTLCFTPPRHVDPAELKDEPPYPKSLLLLYSGIFTSLYTENWSNATQAIGEAILIYAPPEMKFIISRFNSLLNETGENLKDVKIRIEAASNMIEWARFEEARNELNAAKLNLAKVNITVRELEASAAQLSSILHTSPQPLMEGVSNLKALISKYDAEISSLFNILSGYSVNPPTETRLTLRAEIFEVKLGSNLTLEGELTTIDGEPLPSREIEIKFMGTHVWKTYTRQDGTYRLNFKVPFMYIEKAEIHSIYMPRGNDYGRYTPAASKVEISLIYEKPRLEVEAPTSAYPGFSFNLAGKLMLDEEPLPNFNIRVEWLGASKSLKTDSQGRLHASLEIPPEVPSGYKEIKVESLPEGEIGPAHKSIRVNVVRAPIKTSFRVPAVAFTGLKLTVTGEISVDRAPLKNCSVKAKIGEWFSTTEISSEGVFKTDVNIPLFAPTSQYELWIYVKPREAWVETKVLKENILVINLVGISALPVIFGGVTLITARSMGWIQKRKKKSTPKIEVSPTPKTEKKRETEIRGIPAIYLRAVSAVSRFTGVSLGPNQSIREYLKDVRSALRRAYKPFERLSLDYEMWLYGSPAIRTEAERLESLLENLLEELKH